MSGKKISIFLAVLIVIIVGFLWYQKGKGKKNQNTQSSAKLSSLKNSPAGDNSAADANSDQAMEDFDAQCTNGQWVKIADVEGEMTTAKGVVQAVDPENTATAAFQSYRNYLDGSEKIALVDPNVKTDTDDSDVDLFQTREVEVQGVLGQGAAKEAKVSQIRCAGKETDKNAADDRTKILNYISANISSIAPEKAPQKNWVASSVVILDEKDVYVDYYDAIEDDENSDPELDTTHRVLLEIAPGGNGNFNANVLAYWVPGEEDFVLKQGNDKFKNLDEFSLPSYSYDSESNSWSRD
ncbi:MAG: hypothetical protein WC643_00120 [Parcubacteria group bacterium]|jgi:hypothetical protein